MNSSCLDHFTSQVNDNRLTAMLLKPITMAKNAFKSRNSLQLKRFNLSNTVESKDEIRRTTKRF